MDKYLLLLLFVFSLATIVSCQYRVVQVYTTSTRRPTGRPTTTTTGVPVWRTTYRVPPLENRNQPVRQDPRYSQYDVYDPSGQQGRQDPRYGSQDPRYGSQDPSYSSQDPRYDSGGRIPDDGDQSSLQYQPYRQPTGGNNYYQPGYDSRSQQPVLKSLVLSEDSIYLWWTDPQNSRKRMEVEGSNETVRVKYSIKWGKLSDPSSETVEEVSSGKEHQLKSLEAGTDYTFSLKKDEEAWSSPIRNRTFEALPTEAPTEVKVETHDREATITISPPESLKGHVSSYLFLYAPSGGSSTPRGWSEQQVSGYSYTGGPVAAVLRNLQPGEEYFYTIQAINSRGAGPFSEIKSFRTEAQPDPNAGRRERPEERRTFPEEPREYPEEPAYPTYAPYTYPPYEPYATNSPYDPQYEETTEDYYSRYSTPFVPGHEQSSEDSSPYWRAATPPSSHDHRGSSYNGEPSGSGPLAPTDIRVEGLDGPPGEAMVMFTPSASNNVRGYEILYAYDPSVAENLWQIETVPGDESQTIIVQLTPNAEVFFKVRAKDDRGVNGDFSETVSYLVRADSAPGADQDHEDHHGTGDEAVDADRSHASGDHPDI